jgi:hypothetical protein
MSIMGTGAILIVAAFFVDQGWSLPKPQPGPQFPFPIPGVPPPPKDYKEGADKAISSANLIPGATTFTGPISTAIKSAPPVPGGRR